MKVKWNNCFLCLNDLSDIGTDDGVTGKKKRRARKPIVTKCKSIKASAGLLLNYLLDTKCKKYLGVIGNIVELIEDHGKSKAKSTHNNAIGVKFCDKCEAHLKNVSELHEQLEVVQMKLVHVLKYIQSTIVTNSKKNGAEGTNGEDSRGIGLNIFEDWLKEQENSHLNEENSQIKEQRKILDFLYLFQAAVVENAKNSIAIPRVFLDTFTRFKPHTTVDFENSLEDIMIKTEAVDLDEMLDNMVPSPHSPPQDPDWCNETFADDEPPIQKGRKRKAMNNNTASSSTTKVKVKQEEDDGIVPQKKIRAASLVARLSISANKRKTKKKGKLKSEKAETPRKHRARILQPFRLMPHSEKHKCYKPGQYWACATCSFTSRNMFRFQHHLRTHEAIILGEEQGSSPTVPLFRCEKCEDLTFSVKQHYQFHKACHDGFITMTCDVCNVPCEPITLVEHMKTHLEKVFPCPNCSYCCSTRDKYVHHLSSHINSTVHECDICRKTFTSKKQLLVHYHKDHQVLEKVACDAEGCSKEFLDPDSLQKHKYSFHTKTFVCQHCGKSLCSAQSLETHLVQHSGVKPFPCQHCSETFSCKANLNRHMVSQHEAPKVKCEYCEKEYAEMSSLKIHMAQIHTGSEFVCDHPQCGKIFGTRSLLKRHMAIHSEERNFSCEQCGKKFKMKQDVKKHSLIHFGEKKFKCDYCEKTFLYEKYLTQHLRIHTGEKPFVCDHCGSAFNQYAALYMHKRNCHLKN